MVASRLATNKFAQAKSYPPRRTLLQLFGRSAIWVSAQFCSAAILKFWPAIFRTARFSKILDTYEFLAVSTYHLVFQYFAGPRI